MPDQLEAISKEIGAAPSRGLQLARELMPTALDVITGNPHTLAEWLIFIALFPVTLPLNFAIWAMRWIMVEAPLLVTQIKNITGVSRTGVIGEALARCGGGIDIIGGIIQALTNPSNEFDLGIMESAASGVTTGALDLMLDPILRPIGFCMNRIAVNNLISAGQAAELFHKGYFDQSAVYDIASAYGYGSEATQGLIDVTRSPPDFMSIITMLNRGYIDQGTAYSWIRQSGTDADFINPLLQLRQFVPGMGEIAGYQASFGYSADLRGKFDLDAEFPTECLADAAKNGATEREARMNWLMHWSYPGVGATANMLFRKLISLDEAYALLQLNGIPNPVRQAYLTSQESIFTQRYIRNLYKYGIIDYAELVDSYGKLGFNNDRAVKMANLAVKMVNPISQESIANTLKTAYSDGLVNYNTAMQSLQAAGHSEYEATLQLAIADHNKGGDILKTVESYLHTGYIDGDLGLEYAMEYLDQYGITNERKNVLRELWTVQKNHTIKHVSEGDARKAYQIGLVNASQLRSFLEMLHYDEDSISVMIAIDNATMVKPQENLIAPITSATGKAKSFTKAELKNMLVDGIIDSQTWYYEMASLGYTDAQIQVYLELIISGAKKSKGAAKSAA